MTFTATLAPDDAPQIALNAQSKPVASVRKRTKWLAQAA
jgi:hypothetical protein